MRSSLKLQLEDRNDGQGMQPVIEAIVASSDDMRDTAMRTLFQSARHSNGQFLEIKLEFDKDEPTADGLPDKLKVYRLRVPTIQPGVLSKEQITDLNALLLKALEQLNSSGGDLVAKKALRDALELTGPAAK